MIGELKKTNSKQQAPKTVCVTRQNDYFVVTSPEKQYLIHLNSDNVKQTRDDDFVVFHDQTQNIKLKVSIDVGIPIEKVLKSRELEIEFNPQAIQVYLREQ